MLVVFLWDLVYHLLDESDFSFHKFPKEIWRSEITPHPVFDEWIKKRCNLIHCFFQEILFEYSFWRHFKRFCEVLGYVSKEGRSKKLL